MRIAIVNDAMMALEALRRIVDSSPEHQVAWIARDGAEAVERCAQDTPDLVLMDLIMPVMDGVEATRRIMAQTPCAILVVTATVEGHAAKVFEALGAGALDVVSTPVLSLEGGGAESLLAKLRIMERLVEPEKAPTVPIRNDGRKNETTPLVVVGASAGGPSALATILCELPYNFPAAVVIVQHVDAQFAHSMAGWLNDQTPLNVRIAEEGDEPRIGTVLLAGKDDHLICTQERKLDYTAEPLQCSYRPSIDVFFRSAAEHYRDTMAGVLLTGMGRDGARGLKCLREAGAITIAQDRSSCVVYGMPKAAVDLDAADEILDLEEIAPRLNRIFSQSRKMVS